MTEIAPLTDPFSGGRPNPGVIPYRAEAEAATLKIGHRPDYSK